MAVGPDAQKTEPAGYGLGTGGLALICPPKSCAVAEKCAATKAVISRHVVLTNTSIFSRLVFRGHADKHIRARDDEGINMGFSTSHRRCSHVFDGKP